MDFQDHFSKQAAIYAKARPTYPEELFDYLAGLVVARDHCWDCATGNGQAAVALASRFDRVIATDGSENQIRNAQLKPNIEYRVATAERSGLPDRWANLITVATAAHWFNHDLFYAEAQRVAKRNAVLAVWTYSEAKIEPAIDEVMEWFMYELLYDYWPDGRWYVRQKYETLPFPFEQVETPDFFCERNWTKEEWLDYIRSWSAYNEYVSKKQADPLQFLATKLNPLWAGNDIKKVLWKLHIKCARLNTGGG